MTITDLEEQEHEERAAAWWYQLGLRLASRGAYAAIVLLVLAGITVPLAMRIKELSFNNSVLQELPRGDYTTHAFEDMLSKFG